MFAQTVSVPGKRLDEFASDLGLTHIDLLKMDIEGAELDVLASCSDRFLRSIAQLTVEFHDHVGVVSKEDIRAVIRRFHSLGFVHLSRYRGCYYDTLFINRARCHLPLAEYFWLRHCVQNWRGVVRRLDRFVTRARSTEVQNAAP